MSDIVSQIFDITKTIPNIEKRLLDFEQQPCPVFHHFSPGVYVREVNLPAGILAIGHYQKREHLNIFLKGRVTMLNDDGSVSELKAPMIFTGKPGRKMGYVHEDIVWLNVYPTEETDIKKLEETYIDKSEISLEHIEKNKGLPRLIDQEDYKRVLAEFGYDEATARAQSENEDDQVPFPDGSYAVGVFPSVIEGRGLFATAPFKDGDIIAPARIYGKRTPAGRYTNHSKRPNAKMVFFGDDIYLVARKDIRGCRGGLLGDEITVDYRNTLNIQPVSDLDNIEVVI